MFKPYRSRCESESDADLVQAACQGSEDAIGELYERHGSMVYRFALRMSGDASMAEEITQEAFLAFLRQPHHFEAHRGAFSTWLCGIARRQLWKRMEREEPFIGIDAFEEQIDPESPLDPYELLSRKNAIDAVRSAIDQLPLWMKEANWKS